MNAVATIRERHVPRPEQPGQVDRIRCEECEQWWPCDVRIVLDALEAAA